jgi:hypothetical protein
MLRRCLLAVALGVFPAKALAQESDAELANKLNNPVAAMISVPLQGNYDTDIGPLDGDRFLLNVQPVIPFALNEDWNVISRTILPVISQTDVFPYPNDEQVGLGDITQSLFFSPKNPGPGGLIWGFGPAFLLPIATQTELGTEKWGIGPTALALKQQNGTTYGVLINHIWSFAGDDERADVNSTFIQPFLSHTTKEAWTFGLNLESTYDWDAEAWSVPINATVSKLVRFGEQRVSLGGGVRYWADAPDGGPEGWGFRLIVTFLFPEK